MKRSSNNYMLIGGTMKIFTLTAVIILWIMALTLGYLQQSLAEAQAPIEIHGSKLIQEVGKQVIKNKLQAIKNLTKA